MNGYVIIDYGKDELRNDAMKEYNTTLEKLATRFSLSAIYAFGSRGKEVYNAVMNSEGVSNDSRSDIDIGITVNEGVTLKVSHKVDIAIALEELFEVGRVDLVLVNDAPPFLALDIIKGELLYCSDQILQAQHELYVLRRAGDLAHYERERRDMLLHGK